MYYICYSRTILKENLKHLYFILYSLTVSQNHGCENHWLILFVYVDKMLLFTGLQAVTNLGVLHFVSGFTLAELSWAVRGVVVTVGLAPSSQTFS